MLALTFSTAIFLLLIYFSIIYKKFTIAIPFYILFLFEITWDLLSLVYIENGTYISEEATTSFYTGATYRFVLIILPFIILAPMLLNRRLAKIEIDSLPKIKFIKLNNNQIIHILQVVSILIFLYLNFDVIISGTPLFNDGITRFNFYSNYSKMPLTDKLNGFAINFLILINGIVFWNKNFPKSEKVMAIIVFLLAVTEKILLDNKFFPFMILIYYFTIPKLIDIPKSNKVAKIFSIKNIFKISVLVSIFVYISYYKYSQNYENPSDILLGRIFALQAHSFWGMDKYVIAKINGIDLNQFLFELISGFKNLNAFDTRIGLAKVMTIISPSNIVYDYLNANSRFSGGYFTVSIGYLGYWMTFLYSIFMALLFIYFSKSFYVSIKKKEYILIYFNLIIFNNIYEYFRIGNLSIIMNYKMLILMIFIVSCNTIRKKTYLQNLKSAKLNKKLSPIKEW